jgi:hypothetical protein
MDLCLAPGGDMAEKTTKELAIGAFFGIVGVLIGSLSTSYMNMRIQAKQQQNQEILDVYKFDQGQYPAEFFTVKIFVDKTRALSTLNSDTISRLAEIQRKYPACETLKGKNCFDAAVEGTLVTRDALGSGHVRREDIEVLLRPYYDNMVEAVKKLKDDSQ